MTYQRVYNKSSTMGVTCGAGTAYTSGKHELTPLFSAFMLLAPYFSVQCFVDRCVSFRLFSFGHCIVCLSSIYGF